MVLYSPIHSSVQKNLPLPVYGKKVACGGGALFEVTGEKIFWGETENFMFCLGELTLDDTVVGKGFKLKWLFYIMNELFI